MLSSLQPFPCSHDRPISDFVKVMSPIQLNVKLNIVTSESRTTARLLLDRCCLMMMMS